MIIGRNQIVEKLFSSQLNMRTRQQVIAQSVNSELLG